MMKRGGRYDVSDMAEAQHEPGSRGRVLRNLLGIRRVREMDEAETLALQSATDAFLRTYDEDHRFRAQDVCDMHRVWLGPIYAWAGAYRQVNISKGNFPFAMAARVPALMLAWERDHLARHTPCRASDMARIAAALAEVHVELVLIHPFRDGNGRIARTLAILMAAQAQLPLLDFSVLAGRRSNDYFAAVQAGMGRDYRPMARLFEEVISKGRV